MLLAAGLMAFGVLCVRAADETANGEKVKEIAKVHDAAEPDAEANAAAQPVAAAVENAGDAGQAAGEPVVAADPAAAQSEEATAEQPKTPRDPHAGDGKTVFVLPIHGPIDKGMLFVFRRAFRQVESVKPEAIILDINTPGGGLRETEEILAWIRSCGVPVYAYAHPEATSAGAILCFGTKKIFVAPSANVGSAMPVMISMQGGVQELPADYKEKILSYVRSLVRGLAQENGHSEELAMAMVDAKKEVKIGDRVVCAEGELLNLTAREAVEVIAPNKRPLLAEAIVNDMAALLVEADLGGAEIKPFQEEPVERLARIITMISPLLLSIGILGIFMEMRTPGFGFPGIVGLICISIFFFGHYIAGLAGLEDMVLVFVGLILLGVEIFVIPGFGITGILGIICIAAGLLLGMVPWLPKSLPGSSITWVYVEEAMTKLLITAILSGLGAWALAKILPKTSTYRKLVLDAALGNEEGYVSANVSKYEAFVGRTGLAMTALRPAGTAVFGDDRLSVVSSGDLIPRDASVRVIQVEGSRVVVEQFTPPAADPDANN